MKKTERGKKARMIFLEIRPSVATSKSIERQNVAMLQSNLSKLGAEVLTDEAANAEFLKNSENGRYCVKLRKFNAELRVIEKIKQLNFEIISRKLA